MRVFTINRSLADLLRESIVAVNGSLPPNLHVGAFYDLMVGALGLFGGTDEYRLVDDRSGERIADSWRDFFQHQGTTPARNVFAEPDVEALVNSIGGRANARFDACQYLRDELVYIESAYRAGERERYLTEPRVGRAINLLKPARRACLTVLAAWEEWLRVGHLCDVDGLTRRAVERFESGADLDLIRSKYPTDHVLVDEVQDFSTLELRALRRLVTEPDGPNRFFFVGDLNQKVFPKQHVLRRAGFDFTGRSRALAQNYRNTRQILAAAYRLPQFYPPRADEPTDVADPELSPYKGGRPVVLACRAEGHAAQVVDLVRRRAGQRVAVVSENEQLLGAVRTEAARQGVRCYELFRVEDLDLWQQQEGGSLRAGLVVSRLEAVKGFEFDTVIACDLSEGVVPRAGTPTDEYGREAAVLYAALTRARDELVMTHVGARSVFLDAMADDVEFHDGHVGEALERVLAAV